jgi:hypothetical protein
VTDHGQAAKTQIRVLARLRLDAVDAARLQTELMREFGSRRYTTAAVETTPLQKRSRSLRLRILNSRIQLQCE